MTDQGGVFAEVERIFARRGDATYGEDVTQRRHALQAAHFAEREGAPDEMVVAALLHDVGHMLDPGPEDAAEAGADARHEEVGHAWLAERFPPVVAECARLHVQAKRYLCATDPDYAGRLSEASRRSLVLQGGPMSPEEAEAFAAGPFAREALRLRAWDDLAKDVHLEVAPLAHYRRRVEALALTVAGDQPGGTDPRRAAPGPQ